MLQHIFVFLIVLLTWAALLVTVAFPGSPYLAGPIAIASALVFLVAFLPHSMRRSSLKNMMIAIVIFGIFSAGVGAIRYAPNTRYNVAYSSIRLGMTLSEAEGVVRRELDYRVIPDELSLDDGFVRLAPIDSPDERDDCIVIFMANGLVAEICPIPD